MKPILTVEGISKKYKIDHFQGKYVTLRDRAQELFVHPIKTLHELQEKKEEFWALKDVSFSLQKGDVVGIVGANGAGKSTLLKILSRITPPTEGSITIEGRVASLLEVGTGFHPELTGRENIFLNGAILGMQKSEIIRKFDEIVDFSGVEKFIDTPVKFYSSGMYVRLAFSVAAHLDPDILIIDEVLAVGDAEFQKKCLGKMDEVSKTEGRTILFVSHNMAAVRQLCKKSLLLHSGLLTAYGDTVSVIDQYLHIASGNKPVISYPRRVHKNSSIVEIAFLSKDGIPKNQIPVNENFSVRVKLYVQNAERNALLSLLFYNEGELLLFSSESDQDGQLRSYASGVYETTVDIPAFLFNVGYYQLEVALHRPFVEYLDRVVNVGFEISDEPGNHRSSIFQNKVLGKMGAILDYNSIKKEHYG